jgi:serine/threonine protein kinase
VEKDEQAAVERWWEMLRLGTDFLDKVKALHAAGICHGDVALSNALMKDGRVLICDFSTAVWETDALDVPTTAGDEQLDGLRMTGHLDVGYAADRWAAMVSILEMCGVNACGMLKDEAEFSMWLAAAVADGSIGSVVRETVMGNTRFPCPEDVAVQFSELVQLAVSTQQQ